MNKQNTSYMGDTNQDMQDYQYKLIMSKSPQERFRLGLEMMEAGREFMLAGIKNQKPGLSEEEYRVELLKRLIRFDKSLHWLNDQLLRS